MSNKRNINRKTETEVSISKRSTYCWEPDPEHLEFE